MNEYQKLKLICDKIGYGLPELCELLEVYSCNIIISDDMYKIYDYYNEETGEEHYKAIKVREIIFTQEFIGKFINFAYKGRPFMQSDRNRFCDELIGNLNNPVDYLAELLDIKE